MGSGNGDEKKKVPYARYAFANPYNLSLLAGAAAVALGTGNWMLGVAAAGAEAIWMLFAPDSRLLRKFWFDKKHAVLLEAAKEERLQATIANLPERDRGRCLTLREKVRQIDRLSEQNPAFTAELLRSELGKLSALADSFVEMSVTCTRYLEYLDTVDLDALERDVRRYAGIVDRAPEGDEQRALALKNLEVLQRRRAKIAEIRKYVGTARAQLDLIENTFQLLADQIVTMRSPQELSGQLDNLLDGVEAVRQTTRETEKLLQAIER
ncbi:MAG TPA: hypothetical protein VH877_19750 [Polyangia bacterium]|nr:hypothetical protein [Polyangia bacterium]